MGCRHHTVGCPWEVLGGRGEALDACWRPLGNVLDLDTSVARSTAASPKMSLRTTAWTTATAPDQPDPLTYEILYSTRQITLLAFAAIRALARAMRDQVC